MIDSIQKVDIKEERDDDIISRFYSRVFTQHHVRRILLELDDEDLRSMMNVSTKWRNIVKTELGPNIRKIV